MFGRSKDGTGVREVAKAESAKTKGQDTGSGGSRTPPTKWGYVVPMAGVRYYLFLEESKKGIEIRMGEDGIPELTGGRRNRQPARPDTSQVGQEDPGHSG